MEVNISNNYVQGFVSRFTSESASKAIKYLAILGIHFLQTVGKQNVSFAELKSLAKNMSQVQPAGGKYINQELKVIKEELAQLSKKVNTKLGNVPVQQKEKNPTEQNLLKKKEVPTAEKTQGLSNKFDPKVLTHKPPSAWREGEKRGLDRRPNQLDNVEDNYENKPMQMREPARTKSPSSRSLEKRDGSLGSSKGGEYAITPKPNEIAFPGIDLTSSKNKVTRHHLDDTEARKILNEEGVIFFPTRDTKDTRPNTRDNLKQHEKSPYFGGKRPQDLEETYNAEWSDNINLSPKQKDRSNSPGFAQSKDDNSSKLQSTATFQGNKENMKPPGTRSSSNHAESKRATTEGHQSQQKLKGSQRKATNDKMKKSSRNRQSYSQLGNSKLMNSQNYLHVESKIKDEINYHKELSKQYKKMKHSISQSGGFEEELLLGTSSRFEPSREHIEDKYPSTTRHDARGGPSQNIFEESSRYRMSKLMESTNSTQRSSLTMQQLSSNNHEDKAHQHYHHPGVKINTEETAPAKNENRGGLLEIANNFLNSPLMQNISNIDIKDIDTPLKDSVSLGPTAMQKNARPINYLVGTPMGTDFKEQNGLMQSLNNNYHSEEDRFQTRNPLQQSRYSNWGTERYHSDKTGKQTQSILKDSTNRRFRENMDNELRASDNNNKEGINSLASSNFSNFLNEEMKGFYQKERLDLKKPKSSELIMKFGSSDDSSNMSFSESIPINDKALKKSHFRKSEYRHALDNTANKTLDGVSFDNANVFKNERMSVTQLLNN